VLTGWAGGPKADEFAGRSPAELESAAVEVLSRIFGEPKARILSLRSSAHTHDWSTDPFALGAYSYIPVGGLDLPKTLEEPLADTLYFAGECMVTDAQTGTVFGAMESGARAAREALKMEQCT
jgi:monoamine oxidase